ncbi:MAG: Rv3235 family protein [Cellulomonas sp.]
MTALTLDRALSTYDVGALTATESAVVGLAAAVDALASAGTAPSPPAAPAPAAVDGRPASAPAAHTGPTVCGADEDEPRRTGPRTPPTTARLRLVPSLAALPRLAAPTGPGHSRPPTVDDRVLARRRAALAAERAAATAEAAVGPVPTGDPTSVCCSLVLAAVESLAGIRAVAQLARWVTPEVYQALSTRAALTVRVLGARAATCRPEVRRVRVCRIGEHVAEASVVIDDGRRVRAVAVRLESWRGSWRAVALEIG